MQLFYNFIVFFTLIATARLDDLDPTPPMNAKATVSSGESRLFSGENVQMTCSVPDDPLPAWTYKWFHDGVLLGPGEVYSLNKARVPQSGEYTCQGEKTIKEWPYIVSSNQSNPIKIHVDGGWALLQAPIEPMVVDETMTLTCRVRGNHLVSDVIFYKDGDEIQKQKHKNLVFHKLQLEDDGIYSCRATWFMNVEYQSAQALPFFVTVLDKIDTPQFKFQVQKDMMLGEHKVIFRCEAKINVREEGLSLEYYYFKDGNRLGRVSGKEEYIIPWVDKDDTGLYSCKVRLRPLNIEKSSKEVKLDVQTL